MFRVVTIGAVMAVTASGALAQSNVHVDGYTRRDGTYVQPHNRTAPDSTRTNNYGSQGQVNPYTGQAGRIDPYQPQPNYGNSYGGMNNLNQQRRSNGW